MSSKFRIELPRMTPSGKQGPDKGGSHRNGTLLIQGSMAITMVRGQAPIPEARILVSGGIIVEIGTVDQVKPPTHDRVNVIDAGHVIILPGLVNAHTHSAMTLFRGMADDLPLRKWLFEKIFPAEAEFLSPETVYWGALLGCLEMIASGTTCFLDGYFFQDQTVRAVHESGMRGLIAQGVIDFPAPGVPEPRENIKAALEFMERWSGFSDLITPGIFCHSPLTCSSKTLTKALEISSNYGVPLQIHLSETKEEVHGIIAKSGMRPARYLDQLGLTVPSLIAAHGVHLDPEEIRLLSRKGVKIAHVPESNMKLGSGVADVSGMIRSGLALGLGTDGCSSNNDLDLLREMDTASKLAKVFDMDPSSLKAREVLEMATTGGARLMGLEKEIGTLEKGKKADIITVDLDRPHLCPLYDPVSALVYSANGADVKDVIVDGKVLMRNREFKTLDPDEIMARVRELTGKLGTRFLHP